MKKVVMCVQLLLCMSGCAGDQSIDNAHYYDVPPAASDSPPPGYRLPSYDVVPKKFRVLFANNTDKQKTIKVDCSLQDRPDEYSPLTNFKVGPYRARECVLDIHPLVASLYVRAFHKKLLGGSELVARGGYFTLSEYDQGTYIFGITQMEKKKLFGKYNYRGHIICARDMMPLDCNFFLTENFVGALRAYYQAEGNSGRSIVFTDTHDVIGFRDPQPGRVKRVECEGKDVVVHEWPAPRAPQSYWINFVDRQTPQAVPHVFEYIIPAQLLP